MKRALDHSIFAYGDTLDELRLMVKDAVNVHFDGGEAFGYPAADGKVASL